ncbi:FUSC family protein [Cellvibrio sp. NN19]|uniref:FUSC family protein n=1 Tax=Cellvibrio chitinivorans TaxID=3102792 RepID=UPI002B410E9A|nr:FUSC family protein [Cellvibrio sp. NN19]
MNFIKHHIAPLFALKKANRPWHIPFIASIAVGIPTSIGAYFGRFDLGLIGCLGAMVFLYIRPTSIPHRMATMVVCAFGFAASFALGLSVSFYPYLGAAILGYVATLAAFITRFYAMPPPGSFFFILVTVMGVTLPFDLAALPMRVGLMTLGGILSCLLVFFYSLWAVHRVPVIIPEQQQEVRTSVIVMEACVIGLFVGGSYLIALLIGLPNPYWVPISAAAIMQGVSFRMVWHRKVHRIAGTVIGMGLAWVIFQFSLTTWEMVAVIVLLNFLIEFLVVRNYGLAVIFITPLTVLFAEASPTSINPDLLLKARLFDIVLGSLIGFAGGWVLHQSGLFNWLYQRLNERKVD